MQKMLLTIFIVCFAGGAIAAPVTMACRYRESNSPSHMFTEIDQIIVDVEGDSVFRRGILTPLAG
jgi:hypothetical protein